MPQDHGTPGSHVIDIAFAVRVVEVGTSSAVNEYRIAAHAVEGPYR